MKKEIWKEIDGYEGLYSISTFGRVKSHKRGVLIPLYGGIRLQEERILNSRFTKGYLSAQLCKSGKKKMFVKIHILKIV